MLSTQAIRQERAGPWLLEDQGRQPVCYIGVTEDHHSALYYTCFLLYCLVADSYILKYANA